MPWGWQAQGLHHQLAGPPGWGRMVTSGALWLVVGTWLPPLLSSGTWPHAKFKRQNRNTQNGGR